MGFRTEFLKVRAAILHAGVMSVAMLPGFAARAADQAVLTPAEVVPWYFYGGFEVGGRFYAQRPPTGFGRAPAPDNWLTAKTSDSRAKFEEYGSVRPGLFLDWINLQAGTKDGTYAFDFWGKSVGANNQSYYLDLAKIGEHYLSVGWDQTPHLISTSAKTVFGGVGSSFLTVNPTLRANLQANLPNAAATGAAGQTARNNIESFVNNAATGINLATQRDKASAAYRYTPTDDVDVKAEYSHEQRTGTRPTGIPYGWGTTANPRPTNPVEVAQPIDDTTQNVSASGEYVGSTPWGTRWTSSLKYAGSFYNNNINSLDVQNPFCITCNVLAGANRGPNTLRLALAPDNQANALTWNTAVTLPFLNTRYVATVQYNRMRQNDPFVSTATNGLAPLPLTLGGVPVGSLNGEVNTLLWNNVLTASLSKDVKLTVKGRHYDVDNRTPSLLLTNYAFGDSGLTTAGGAGRQSLPISYTKDNVSAEVTWRTPVKWLSVGSGYYWERWDRKFRDVDVTNEHMGKVWVDALPVDWARARASVQYAERRYHEYNTEELVEAFSGPGNFSEVASNMRRFDIANRDRVKAEASVEFTALTDVTITPNAGLRLDDYPDSVFNPLGLRKDHSWNAGIEAGVRVSKTLRLLASYNYEDHKLDIAGGSGGANIVPLGLALTGCPTAANPESIIGTDCTWRSNIAQRYHTVMFAADWKAIPNTLEFRLEYLMSFATEANATTPCPSANVSCTGGGVGVTTTQFPDERNRFQRFNATARYIVDPDLVRKFGWTGDVVAKLRYTWERNQADNWAFDNMTPYIPTADQTTDLTGGGRSLFLAAFNPNYTAQIVAASLAFRW